MQTNLTEQARALARGEEAESILRSCVHCGFCNATCPSGVDYHNLLDIGRAVVEQAVPRPFAERLLRASLRQVVPRPALFKALTQAALVVRPLLPAGLQDKRR